MSDLDPIVAAIRSHHRRRVFAMDQRKRSDLALGAFLRLSLGWSRTLPKAEAAAINERAQTLIEIGEKTLANSAKPSKKHNKLLAEIDTETFTQFEELRDIITAAVLARAPMDEIEDVSKKNMEELAKQLPVWEGFGEAVAGFGLVSLAVIVAEAGDLANYPTPAKLWKRMGLAPILKGNRNQAGSTWRKGGLTAEDWTAAGYSMRRRSYIFVIGDVLIKNQGKYREVYLQRKQYERDRAVENGLTVVPAAKIPAKRASEFMSDGHVHRRAQRYMEKRFLLDLWTAWQAMSLVKSSISLPADARVPGQPSSEIQPSVAGH